VLPAQQPLGFLDQAHRDRFPRLEKQQPPDDLGTGIDVQLVRQAVEGVVLSRVVEIEDVVGLDADLPDARPGGLELGESRNALGRLLVLRAGRPGRRGQSRQATEKAMPKQVTLN